MKRADSDFPYPSMRTPHPTQTPKVTVLEIQFSILDILTVCSRVRNPSKFAGAGVARRAKILNLAALARRGAS